MWLQAIKLAAQAGSKIYANRQKAKMAMSEVKLFFEMFSQLPSWFTNLWILVVASIYGIKGTQIFRNGKK